MHEASLAAGVLQMVEQSAQREGFKRVLALRIEAGQLAGVDTRALRFALECLAPDTLLEGAIIEIDEPAGRAWCLPCAQSVLMAQRSDPCPHCGGHQLQPTGGLELRVTEMRVLDS